MPSLKESIAASARFRLDTTSEGAPKAPPVRTLEPSFNRMIRCPLPPTVVTPDSLRQYYIGGQVPQHRLLTPPSSLLGVGGGGGVVENTTVINNGGGSTPSTISLKAKQASVTTNVLNQGDVYTGIILVAKSFQLLSVSASSPARIELYGNADSQSIDSSRGIDQAPPAGTMQNLITDVVLDSNPLQFFFQNRIGVNADNPQSASIYVSVTNLDTISEAVTVSIQFVPVEQP